MPRPAVTRADILRWLGSALHGPLCDLPARMSTERIARTQSIADEALAALRALAREPDGAEAVAEAVGLTVEVWPGCRCAARDACDCAGRIVAARKERGT